MEKSVFVCPKCKNELNVDENRYFCKNGHSYDLSADRYVNLLLPNMKNSKDPGDDKNMVSSRQRFLDQGYYSPLRKKLKEIIFDLSKGEDMTLLDIGCGEGYYIEEISSIKNISIKGIDISKNAVIKAGKRIKKSNICNIELAVASAFDLPLRDCSVDIVTNIFSPLCLKEINRVSRPGSRFIYVVPGPNHLWTLKKIIYDRPYVNEYHIDEYEGLSFLKEETVDYEIDIKGEEMIRSLFYMTPYLWHTPKEFMKRIDGLEKMTTEVSFRILIYSK